MRTLLHRRSALLALVTAPALLAGCSPEDEDTGAAPETDLTTLPPGDAPSFEDLLALDGRTIVDTLEAVPVADRPGTYDATVHPTEVVLSDRIDQQAGIALPKDLFPLAVAPYREQTHECDLHVPTGCVGEMRGEDVHLRVVDTVAGTEILAEDRTLHDSGFTILWLPRRAQLLLEVSAGSQRGSAEVSTGEGDLTCLTSLRLSGE